MTQSAGILAFRRLGADTPVQVLLVHPGGPLWTRKDDAAWSLPKGEYGRDDDPLETARREFCEEIGSQCPDGEFLPLGHTTLKSGKRVTAWAIEADLDVSSIHSNLFTMEWPPRSGRMATFPEVDRAQWFAPEEARRKIHPGQAAFLDRLDDLLAPAPTQPAAVD